MNENKNTQNSAIGIPTGLFPNATQNSRSKKLLDKVFDHLDTIEVSKLSMDEMKDFLEVVQKGQFLESYGTTAALGFNYCAASPFYGSSLGQGNAGVCEGHSSSTQDE